MDASRSDAPSRVAKLMLDYCKLLDTAEMTWILNAKPKVVAQHLLEAVCPEALRDTMKAELANEMGHLRKDVGGFRRWLKRFAAEFARFELVVAPTSGLNTTRKVFDRKVGRASSTTSSFSAVVPPGQRVRTAAAGSAANRRKVPCLM